MYPSNLESSKEKTFKALYFAAAKDATQMTCENIPMPNTTLTMANLSEFLAQRHPALKRRQILEGCLFTVNEEYVDPETIIKHGDEVAIIPPVSGG
ncbi:Molybdopterin synthase sulfur carrier subunit [Neolecta irregularis DAH-3]|uniref:Molybdopterin synthase sulfur carrier subunit n=1 Tax=Neolecta irregularis (strain DAH-3) TaxID=1198029 RepID=A0A1U7LLY0_NEOID|nr:Molybdopterin synthase sulfur carrier subunit [Neolecta irregularis DAH-3]|eukprot:OLL23521.1 Molybdopterin synthase sulfur carrier subunit [Neolecta irregularis DAH-3]